LAGAPPQTLLGELTALPRPPCWILGNFTTKGRDRKRKGRAREGKEGQKRERQDGKKSKSN